MVEVEYSVEYFHSHGKVVAICPELDVSSVGDDLDDARCQIQEAVELFLEGCIELGTLEEVLTESGFEPVDADRSKWRPRKAAHREALSAKVAA